jgi:hypothetical protein
VDLAVQAVGQASKRGITHRVPAPDRLAGDIDAWLTTEFTDMVRSTSVRPLPDEGEDGQELRVALHPAASPASIRICGDGQVMVHAATSSAGPGYHTFIQRCLDRLGEQHGVAWADAEVETDRSEDGSAVVALSNGDRPAVERLHLGWLGQTLAAALTARRAGRRSIHIGTPAGVRFTSEDALATSLGPRDDAWLEAAAGDPRVAIGLWPWWADATDARYLLDRALCLMWTEVRWRPPVTDDERATDDEVLRLLRRAYPLDPSLPYPWRAWRDLIVLRGADEPMARQVADRASAAGGAKPGSDIGYRRQPVTIVHEGWALEVPGSFAERRSDEEWWGGEAGRRITLAAISTGDDSGPMPPDAFLRQVAGDIGADGLRHEADGVVGRARLGSEESSGVAVGVVEGYAAVTGSGAVIRVEFDDASDWDWALDQWRALRPA